MSNDFIFAVPGLGASPSPGPLPPELTLDGSSGLADYAATFTQGGSAVALADSDTVITDPSADGIDQLVVTGSGIVDGADEVISIGADTFPSNADKSTTEVVGGTTFAIAYVAASKQWTITKDGGGPAPKADLESLIEAMTYENTSGSPTTGDRTFTFVLTDGGQNSNSAVSTITVAASVAAPSLTAPNTQYVARSQTINTISTANAGDNGTWSVTSGALPTGLSLNTSTGDITGTVDAGATVEVATIELTCTNGAGSDAVTFDIEVRASYTTISSGDTFPMHLGSANELYQLSENLTLDGSAIFVVAGGVVVDLNGKTLTFDNATPPSLVNGDFELDSNWSWTANITRHAGDYFADRQDGGATFGDIFPLGSSYSAKIAWPSTDQAATHDTGVELEAGEMYVLHAHCKIDLIPGGTEEIYVRLENGGDAHEITYAERSNRGMQLVSLTFTAANTGTYALSIGCRNAGSAPSQNCFIDNIGLKRHGRHGICVGPVSFNLSGLPPSYWYPEATSFSNTNNNCVVCDSAGGGSVVQGNGESYRSTAIWGLRAVGLVVQDVAASANGYQSRVFSTKTDLSLGTPSIVGRDLTLDGSGIGAIESRDNHDDCCIGQGSNGTFERITIAGTVHMGVRVYGASTVRNVSVTGYSPMYTNGYAILSTHQDGGLIENNTLDLESGTRRGHGIMTNGETGATTETVVRNNTVTIRPPENIQEYGGPQTTSFCCQTENASKIKYQNNVLTCRTDNGNAACLRINTPGPPDTPFIGVTITGNEFYAYTELDSEIACCVSFHDIDPAELTWGPNTWTTNKSFMYDCSTMDDTVIENQTFRYIDDGYTPKPLTLNFNDHVTGVIFRDITWYDAGTKTMFDAPWYTSGGAADASSSYHVENTVTIRFVDGGTPQVGLSVVIEDEDGNEVYNSDTGSDDDTDANGEITFVAKEWGYVGPTRTSYKNHYIVTGAPSYHHVDLDTKDQLEVIDIVTDDEGPPPSPTIPSIVASTSNQTVAGTSCVVATPAGGSENSPMIAFMANEVRPTVTPSGWTELLQVTNTITGYEKLTVYYREQSASEPGSHEFGTTLNDDMCVTVHLLQDADLNGVTAWVLSQLTNGAANPVNFPDITPTNDNSLVLRVCADFGGATPASTPTGHTEVDQETIAADLNLMVFSKIENSGATGTVELDKSVAQRSNQVCISISPAGS